jgi:Cd(II)/Pb(II)-responsive transcriptional regulator
MRIGELARQAGIPVDTIRYYEKAGLLPPPPRRPNGYRSYGRSHLERLAFIRHCRALDMSLADVARLLALETSPEADCATVDRLIEAQLDRVRTQIADLQELERQLKALRTRCGVRASVSECGILHELASAAQGGGGVRGHGPKDDAP